MTEEPVLGDAEAGMLVKGFDKELRIPQRDGTMRKGSGADHAG